MEKATISERMRAYVNEKGISQKLMAENMGESEAMVSMMLNGKRKMTVDDYVRACKAIAVSPTKFLVDESA